MLGSLGVLAQMGLIHLIRCHAHFWVKPKDKYMIHSCFEMGMFELNMDPKSYSWFNAVHELRFSGMGPSRLLLARFLAEIDTQSVCSREYRGKIRQLNKIQLTIQRVVPNFQVQQVYLQAVGYHLIAYKITSISNRNKK